MKAGEKYPKYHVFCLCLAKIAKYLQNKDKKFVEKVHFPGSKTIKLITLFLHEFSQPYPQSVTGPTDAESL